MRLNKISRFNQFFIGLYSLLSNKKKTLRTFPINNKNFYYLKKKITCNKNWGDCGGYRISKVPLNIKKLILILLKIVCKEFPNATLFQYKEIIKSVFGVNYSISTIFNFFQEINFSYKKCNQVTNILKYKKSNLEYYGNFLYNINVFDPSKIFYIDECHFELIFFFFC
jgi:hypothetical protein